MCKRFDENYEIVHNKKVQSCYFELRIKMGDACKCCLPGQFFMISVPGVFLRRPFGICDVDSEEKCVSFLYKVIGRGTKILSGIRSGRLQLLGPLGKGYDLKPLTSPVLGNNCTYGSSSNIIVAGGTGIASVYFLASRLKKKGILYYGARSESDLLYLDNFHKLGWKIVLSTEDGSKGYEGYITDILSKQLMSESTIFACGPVPMLKKILQIAKEKNVSGFISLEEKMACGLGNCQGCAVKVDGQNKMTCKDGPVFRIEYVEL
ncbi:MAG: dihydroorotate dehydrogenase electron transfer subunit [Endomicrobium sp.]|jgi:dihydroorotate dehydrogenase electron transfer subunit|nr:dihydroorotate dehydrogenase electron transfer subunit [Endomicrobium sp.]